MATENPHIKRLPVLEEQQRHAARRLREAWEASYPVGSNIKVTRNPGGSGRSILYRVVSWEHGLQVYNPKTRVTLRLPHYHVTTTCIKPAP